MNMRTRLKRGAIGAMLALLVFGAGAFADSHVLTSDVDVTVDTVRGQRSLLVTGATPGNTPSVGGPALLAFGSTLESAPFGTIVTDVMYKNVGYHVYAELSDLFPTNLDGSVNCDGATIDSGLFSIADDDIAQLDPTGIDAVLETHLDLIDTDIENNLTQPLMDALGLLGVDLSGTPIAVEDVPGLLKGTDLVGALQFMRHDLVDPDGGTFTNADRHPSCGESGDGPADRAYIQHAQAQTPDLGSVTGAIFDDAGGELDVADALGAGLLPAGSDTSGSLYDAVETAVREVLVDAGLDDLGNLLSVTDLLSLGFDTDTLLSDELGSVVNGVIDDLLATSESDLTLSLVGQTGVYPSVQSLTFDREGLDSPTGSYHGVMTVTLIDDPDNDSDPTTPSAE